ncbi:MAG: hypothetical protein AMS15_07410 [Planctomycetes bacterium DG_23]|nr:MAG: hypothetical protein AMS15_07410 [Planctomycetes bacterium DG_23]
MFKEGKVERLSIKTSRRNEVVDITDEVQKIVERTKSSEGICVVFVPHTTAAVTINENADPSVRRDILAHLGKLVPESGPYTHREGNSDAHIKAAVLGPSVTLLVEGGRLVLGTWQGIYFCEFDGPRQRGVWVQLIPGAD